MNTIKASGSLVHTIITELLQNEDNHYEVRQLNGKEVIRTAICFNLESAELQYSHFKTLQYPDAVKVSKS